MTFLPLKSVSDTVPPPLVLTVKSGAMSPSRNFSSISLAMFGWGTECWSDGVMECWAKDKLGLPTTPPLHHSVIPLLLRVRRARRVRAELFHPVPDVEQ